MATTPIGRQMAASLMPAEMTKGLLFKGYLKIVSHYNKYIHWFLEVFGQPVELTDNFCCLGQADI